MRTTAEIALRRTRTALEYRDALSKILSTSIETSDLLENLLTLARADAGALGLDMHPVNLSSHVRKAQECAALLSADKNVDVTVETPSSPVWVVADPIAIDRLLLILLDNAVKYTPSGGRCEIALFQSDKQAQISVRDSGIGIAQRDIKNIFDRFYRADRVRSKKNGRSRTGLGHRALDHGLARRGDRCGKHARGRIDLSGLLAGRPECLGSSILSVFHGV